MFVLKLNIGGEINDVVYQSIDECLNDTALLNCLDDGYSTCVLWCDGRRLSGKPIDSADELRESILCHSRTILKQQLRATKTSNT